MSDKPATTLEKRKDRRGLLALMGAGGAAAAVALLSQRNGAEAGHSGVDNTPLASVHMGADNNAVTRGISANAETLVTGSVVTTLVIFPGTSERAALVVENTATPGFLQSATGIRGIATNGTGVRGEGGSTGVLGSGSSNGVFGSSNATGVRGQGKPGVYGLSSSGSGVKGEGTGAGSTGVSAKNVATRRALRTKGRVQMDVARRKTVSGKSNLVTLPTGVNAGAKVIVLATMQGNPGNDAVVQRAFRVDAKHIRIVLSKAPANPVAVGYWIVHTG